MAPSKGKKALGGSVDLLSVGLLFVCYAKAN